MNLGKAIKSVRSQLGLTQQELALRSNISVSYLSLLEQNKRDPSFSTIEAIAAALNIPLSILIFLSADRSELDILDESLVQKLSHTVFELIHARSEQPTLL